MEIILIIFLNTVDALLRKLQEQIWVDSGISKRSSSLFRYLDAIGAVVLAKQLVGAA
jgi:hypothetical protein